MGKTKRVIILLSFIVITIVMGGCGVVSNTKSAYELKTLYVGAIGDDPTGYSEVEEVLWLGERDLRYHLLSPYNSDRFLAEEYSATLNFGYNIAYLINLPAKLIHNIKYDYLLTRDDMQIEDVEGSFDDELRNGMLDFSMVTAIIIDIIYAVIGFILSLVMLVLGTALGFVVHPIQTILDIPSVIWGVVLSIISAVVNIISW